MKHEKLGTSYCLHHLHLRMFISSQCGRHQNSCRIEKPSHKTTTSRLPPQAPSKRKCHGETTPLEDWRTVPRRFDGEVNQNAVFGAIGQSWPVGCIKDSTDHLNCLEVQGTVDGKMRNRVFFFSRQLYLIWQSFDTRSRFFPWAQLLDKQIFSSVKVRRSTAVLQPWAGHGWSMCRFGRCHSAQTFVQRSKRERGQMEKKPTYRKIRGCTTYKAENLAG